MLQKYCSLSGFDLLIASIFGTLADTLLALVFYRLIESGGMNMAQEWYDGNYARVCLPGLDLSSQRLSEILCKIGNESIGVNFLNFIQNLYIQITALLLIAPESQTT